MKNRFIQFHPDQGIRNVVIRTDPRHKMATVLYYRIDSTWLNTILSKDILIKLNFIKVLRINKFCLFYEFQCNKFTSKMC